MTDFTDEDKKIERLIIHKNFIGWLIKKLKAEKIECERTKGDDPDGDILIFKSEDAPRVKEIVRQIHKQNNS